LQSIHSGYAVAAVSSCDPHVSMNNPSRVAYA